MAGELLAYWAGGIHADLILAAELQIFQLDKAPQLQDFVNSENSIPAKIFLAAVLSLKRAEERA